MAYLYQIGKWRHVIVTSQVVSDMTWQSMTSCLFSREKIASIEIKPNHVLMSASRASLLEKILWHHWSFKGDIRADGVWSSGPGIIWIKGASSIFIGQSGAGKFSHMAVCFHNFYPFALIDFDETWAQQWYRSLLLLPIWWSRGAPGEREAPLGNFQIAKILVLFQNSKIG